MNPLERKLAFVQKYFFCFRYLYSTYLNRFIFVIKYDCRIYNYRKDVPYSTMYFLYITRLHHEYS